MFIDILNKVLTVALVLSILNILRHLFLFIQAWVTSTEEEPRKYIPNDTSLLLLGVSLAYMITCVFTGVKI